MFSQQNRADQKTVDENSHENCIPCSNSLGNKNWKHSSTTTTSQPFNLFSANALPLHPWKNKKAGGFLMWWGCIKVEYWLKMSYYEHVTIVFKRDSYNSWKNVLFFILSLRWFWALEIVKEAFAPIFYRKNDRQDRWDMGNI